MKKLALTILITFTCILNYGQSPEKAVGELGKQPIIFIDSVQINQLEMHKYDASDIASVTIVKDSTQLGVFGNTKDGVVYIETKSCSRQRFINYFKSKSPYFKELLESLENDSSFQYILNGKALTENYEGNLAAIDDKVFKSLTILDKRELTRKYKNTNKDFGILIISDIPEDLYEGKKKF